MQRGSSGGSVSIVLLRPLVLALQASPSSLAELLSATDLTPEMVADSEARVSPAQFCVAWATAIRLSGDPTLALRLASATAPGAFGIVEYICRSAPTLHDALAQWCRYLRILDDTVKVGLIEVGTECSLRVITESEAPAPAAHELCFALVVRHARTMVADRLPITEVCFSHDASLAQVARHRAFFDAPVRFGAPHTELVLPRNVLERPLTSADPHLLAILRPTAEETLARGAAHSPPFTEQVRRQIGETLPNDDAQLETVAKRLGMTGRSLQRRLKEEGTAFQTLRDEMRRDLADRYLGQGMSFNEISFLLGFSEPSAFFRAFKRWTGLTPFERRASLLQPA
jgi:AraC-like DNA-binding protein